MYLLWPSTGPKAATPRVDSSGKQNLEFVRRGCAFVCRHAIRMSAAAHRHAIRVLLSITRARVKNPSTES
jgi:hypothetical protein